MNNVTVNREWLIGVVSNNAEKHRAIFDDAVVEFRKQAIERLEALIEQVKTGKLPKYLSVPLPIPAEHSADYRRAIGMLTQHVGDTIEIDSQTYAELVDDDWGWREQFIGTAANYTSLAR